MMYMLSWLWRVILGLIYLCMLLLLEKVNKLCIVFINREKVEDGLEFMFDYGV